MKKLASCLALLASALSASASAATRTVTLSVPGMSCPTCPITVKKALSRLPGVAQVSSNLTKRESTVTFDDSKVNLEDLLMATWEAGYPSIPVSPTSPSR